MTSIDRTGQQCSAEYVSVNALLYLSYVGFVGIIVDKLKCFQESAYNFKTGPRVDE